MKRVFLPMVCGVPLLLLVFASGAQAQRGRICGTVHTRDGETYRGPIRWDKNEAFWDDILDATKRRDGSHRDARRREKTVSILGLKITWDEEGSESSASSGIPFGYLKSLERKSRNRAELTLKNGADIIFYGSATDVGSGVRGIVIQDPEEGEVDLDWEDLDVIDFGECKPDEITEPETRLYGEVETRRGDTFKGFICWDVDEVFYSDILDGEEGHRSRKIPFGKIQAIERRSSSSAWVELRDGDKMRLSGTNDVDSGNRGIIILDPQYGRVTVGWDEFDRLELLDDGDKHLLSYDQFADPKPLHGVVYDEDGDSYEGYIRWDDDETESWERLDGEYRDVSVDVEFSQIDRIEKRSSNSVLVTLKNGNSFRLSGSNDVNEENKGIYVTTDKGDEIEVDWWDFDKVIFK
jgi:hypothetical protein